MFRTSRLLVMSVVACLIIGTPAFTAAQTAKDTKDEVEVVQKSIDVLRELTKVPEEGIPQALLERAEAIVVIPSLVKGGFIIGAKHGKGVMSVRDRSTNSWSPPAFLKMTGGSIGWQIGVESVDLVLLVMNRKGVNELLEDKFTIGGDLSIAAGPVGRNAQAGTNAQFNTGILAYSRSKGLFAGATLEGAGIRADRDDNEAFYGRELGLREIVLERAPNTRPPSITDTWRETLRSLTAKK